MNNSGLSSVKYGIHVDDTVWSKLNFLKDLLHRFLYKNSTPNCGTNLPRGIMIFKKLNWHYVRMPSLKLQISKQNTFWKEDFENFSNFQCIPSYLPRKIACSLILDNFEWALPKHDFCLIWLKINQFSISGEDDKNVKYVQTKRQLDRQLDRRTD